ncbi:MAG: hypothetical protein WBN23_11475 [Woeseia sp.]
MRPAPILLIVSLLWAAPADACRCAQRNLSEYFAAANTVAMGKLLSADDHDDTRTLRFELIGPSYKGTPLRAARSELITNTNISTASCGVQPEIAAFYVIFAQRDDSGQLRIDSCSGSRVHLPSSGGAPVGFADVPPRFVAQQLNGLGGLEVLRDAALNGPRPNDADNETLIGLLDLAPLAHGGSLDVYAAPDTGSDKLARISEYAQLESREHSYEQAGAVVYAALSGWYRLRLLDGRYAWAPAADAGTFFAYPGLAINRLNYLTANWSGFVWPEPGAGLPLRDLRVGGADPAEYAVEVHEMTLVGGMPFLRVTVLKGEQCDSPPPEPGISGWIPAFGGNGRPTAWFWSRGC